MKVVTEPQPRASLIAAGAKTLLDEARPTGYRGRLLIRSSVQPVLTDYDIGGWHVIGSRTTGGVACLIERDVPLDRAREYDLLLGVVVASCELVDCVPVEHVGWPHPCGGTWAFTRPMKLRAVSDERSFGDFAPGRWVWLLDDVRPTTERCPRCWGEGRSPCEPFACPCHEPEWCADVPGVGCDLCRAWHGDLTCPTCSGEKVCPPVRMRGGPGLRTPEWGGNMNPGGPWEAT